MGSRFLSPTLRVCVYLKKTNTSFNWVVLVFKITQGGGGVGVRAHRPRSLMALLLRPSGVARATGRGPDPSRGALLFPSISLGGPGRQLLTVVSGAGRLGLPLPLSL